MVRLGGRRSVGLQRKPGSAKKQGWQQAVRALVVLISVILPLARPD
jgi:hypothetical protein